MNMEINMEMETNMEYIQGGIAAAKGFEAVMPP